MEDETAVRIVTIFVLGAVALASVVGLTVVAVATDRDLFRAELLTFAGTGLVAGVGGVSWLSIRRRRRRHWHIGIGRTGDDAEPKDPPQ